MSSKTGLDLVKMLYSNVSTKYGFGKTLKNIVITEADNGKCKAEFRVQPEQLNAGGGLSGGFIATVIDVFTTYGLVTRKKLQPGVTVDLHVNYVNTAKVGDLIIIDCNTIKLGKELAFLECELRHESDSSVIAKGTVLVKVSNFPLKIELLKVK